MSDKQIILDAIKEMKSTDAFKKIIKKYKADPEEVDLIPICFKKDLDVSARTEHGIIYLNEKLKDKLDELPSYCCHECVHFFQQCYGDGPTKGSSDSQSYLDNPYEQEGFRAQTQIISELDGDKAAKSYVSKLLDHHDIEGKERKEREKDLLQLAASINESSKRKREPKQLGLDFNKKQQKYDLKMDRKELLEDLEKAIEEGPKENHQRPILKKLPEDEQKYRMEQLKKLLKTLNVDTNDAAYFWDESGKSNENLKSEIQEKTNYNPEQTRFKFRDLLKNINIISIPYKNLSAEQVKKLSRLKLGGGSSMTNILNAWPGNIITIPKAQTFIAEEKDTGNYLGWVLLTPWKSTRNITFDSFVDRAYRNEGLGSLLLNQAKNFASSNYPELNFRANSWNEASKNFYQKHQMPEFQAIEDLDPIITSEEDKTIKPDSLNQLRLPFENDDVNDAAYFWDEEGKYNKQSPSDEEYVNPKQRVLKFRDLTGNVEILVKRFDQLSGAEIKKLDRLKLGDGSDMTNFLDKVKSGDKLNPLFMPLAIVAEEKDTKHWVGWMLVRPHLEPNDTGEIYLEIDTFVDKNYRREGLGSMLNQKLNQIRNDKFPGAEIAYGAWSPTSHAFYNKTLELGHLDDYDDEPEENKNNEEEKDEKQMELKF